MSENLTISRSSRIDKIKENYGFELRDAQRLRKIQPVMSGYEDAFVEDFYKKALRFSNSTQYLKNERIVETHKRAIKQWFSKLFSGEIDDEYLYYLENIGYAHVKVGLPSHYVNVMITFIRYFCKKIIMKELPECMERSDTIHSLNVLLDINLDVLTSSYIEEEKNIFFVSKKAEAKIINFSRRFSYGLNLVLVMGLVFMGIFVLGLFAYDISLIFQTRNLEAGLLTTLGSLLMLWVVIELVDTEVNHLKGASFSIKVFISVAMVAIIRKILVASLKSEAVEAQYSLIATLAVLGLLYWMISKTEKTK